MIERSYKEELEKNGICLSTTSGWSMYPLLRNRRDTVVLVPVQGKLNKYDLPLYRRPNGSYVLHRIMEVREDGYVLCGDNQWNLEFPVPQEWMIGVVSGIYRDERYIDMKNKWYQTYIHLWCGSITCRRIILKGLGIWNRGRNKIRRTFFSEKQKGSGESR